MGKTSSRLVSTIDTDLAERVEEALLEDDQVQAHLIKVSCNGGVVYLRGYATHPQAREAATRAAARVFGVQAVVNELTVRRRR